MNYFDKKNNRLVFIDKKPTAEFWDQYWETNDFRKGIEEGKSDKFVSRYTKKFIQPGKSKKILEGGCGKGNFVYSLKISGYDSYGVDFAEKTVNKIKFEMPNLKIRNGNVELLDFSDNFFDGYWSLGIIEHHYAGYDKIASEMKRVLKNGGYLFLTFPHMSLLRKIKGKMRLYPVFDEKYFNQEKFYQFVLDWKTVKSYFEKNGFEFVYKKYFDGTKGLKDEISMFKPYLQKIYDSRNIFYQILNGVISRLTAPFCGHSALLILRKGQKNNQKILKYNNTHLNSGRQNIENFLKCISFENALDLGAGDGDDLMIAKKINSKADLKAIEVYPPAIENLKKLNVKYFTMDIEKNAIPLPNDSLDLIIANQILEHTKEIFWIFHEICRTLKKDQYLIIGVPNLASLHNRILLLLGKQPSCVYSNSAHVRGFTKKDIERFASIGGLKLVGFAGSNFYPLPPFLAKFLSKLLPTFSVGIFFLFKKEREYNGEYLKFPSENSLATNFFTGKTHE